MSESFKDKTEIDTQLRLQFDTTATVRWGDQWEESINLEVVKEHIASFQSAGLQLEKLIPDIFKAVRFDDRDYYVALRDFILSEPGDQFADLRDVMRNAEAVPRPNLNEVFEYLLQTIKKIGIAFPHSQDNLATVSNIELEVISSSEDGDIAQQLLEYVVRLKTSIQNKNTEDFFEEFPIFWYYYFIVKEKLGK